MQSSYGGQYFWSSLVFRFSSFHCRYYITKAGSGGHTPTYVQQPKSSCPTDPRQFRLLLAGIYPVEFRDFFLGDMYCSLTYAMGVRSSWPL